MGGALHRLPASRDAVTTVGAAGIETDETAPLVGITAIRAAAALLRGIAIRTPLVSFGRPNDRHLLKAESLQPIGSFKIRGAYNAIASLSPDERERGIVTHSSGNHAQGVARAARLVGARAVIVMPDDAPAVKVARVRADGAEIVFVGPAASERLQTADRLAQERGYTLVPPYDDDRVIAGQGTCGLEIAEDVPDLAAVLIPIGGGGLASGVAVAVRTLHPGARIVGVEPELAADAQASFREGRIVRISAEEAGRTMADGVRSQAVGRRTFAHLRVLLDDIVTVSEEEIAAAVRLAALESRLVVEPSGAVSIAALRFRAGEAGIADVQGPVVAVVSGGNVDPDRYRALLASPLPGA